MVNRNRRTKNPCGMRIIFLDVDGVLNSQLFANKMFDEEGVCIFSEDILDKRAIACLKQIVSVTGATIVLSSSWRKIPKARANLVQQLAEYGLSIHSDTPYTGKERGDDISAWFKHHKDISVESYVILDDDSDMKEHLPHLVQTNFYDRGLEKKHVPLAVDMLMNTERKE